MLGSGVRLRGIRLGGIVDLLLDPEGRRVLGFVVLCGDGARRLLPVPACEIVEDGVEVSSALVLMEDAYYRERGRTFLDLRGAPVVRKGALLGALIDLFVDENGRVARLVVEGDAGLKELEPDDGLLLLGAGARTSAV